MQLVKAHLPRFSRFAAVGATTAAIYFSLFALLHDVFAVPYGIAVTCGYAAGVVFHFCANRNLTFRDSQGYIPSQLGKYAVVAAINYVITIAVVGLAVEVLSLSPHWGVVAAVVLTTLAGYALFGSWVFRARPDRAAGR
jgi:putative flippase GtrA